jgi:glycerol-3-phosphate O-acyltransferase
MDYLTKLDQYAKSGKLPDKVIVFLRKFYQSYEEAIASKGEDLSKLQPLLVQFLDIFVKQAKEPYQFELFHKAIRKPIDYYKLGMEMIRPLVDFPKSKVLGLTHVEQMVHQLKEKHNVILFANHQIEPDPQVISLLLEEHYPKFAEDIIFVAGHRVIIDPFAIPFSMGRNLLCIYSKKYISTPPELKQEKLLHNQRTLKILGELLGKGGKCIYVAPSGGRDRPTPNGVVEVAPFDPQSIELLWILSKQSKKPTHFYPLALATYDLLPPPKNIQKEIGERRQARWAPAHLSFGEEIDMELFSKEKHLDKQEKRKKRAAYIWNLVRNDYLKVLE